MCYISGPLILGGFEQTMKGSRSTYSGLAGIHSTILWVMQGLHSLSPVQQAICLRVLGYGFKGLGSKA